MRFKQARVYSRVYEISRVHGFCTSCFFFEVWLHHSTKVFVIARGVNIHTEGSNKHAIQ